MERKSVRLSGTSFAVLTLLDHLGEATPYDLKQAIEQTISNFWPVPHTTFYAEPARLAAAGYLSETQEQHGRRRKLYRLTEAGRRFVQFDPDDRKRLFAQHVLAHVPLAQHIKRVLDERRVIIAGRRGGERMSSMSRRLPVTRLVPPVSIIALSAAGFSSGKLAGATAAITLLELSRSR